MSIIVFFIILSILVLVHEFGHFSVARLFGIRVDEFGLGYPPKAKSLFKSHGTEFTLNWLPFGGFVKIFGENPLEGETRVNAPKNSFVSKNRGIQALVLVAGVFFNLVFAWLLISIGFMTGLPSPEGINLPISNPQTAITTVLPNSPASTAGIKSGDTLLTINGTHFSPEDAAQVIKNSNGSLIFKIQRGKTLKEVTLTPNPTVGIAMETIGTVKLPFLRALYQGGKTTLELTVLTAQALGHFIGQAVTGRADLSTVTGPVGLVGMVGDVEQLGFSYLLTFTALISINLCLINLLPFPALDGGRLLFVGIEAVTRKQIPPKIFNSINAAGFALLIFLMILVTIRDVRNIL